MKILLVDDDRQMSAILQMGLQDYNYSVDVAHDGKNGEKLASENHYDLIIMDVMMPWLTGIEVCEKIRNKLNQTPVILISSLDSAEDKRLGLESGADDYLVKPFSFEKLFEKMRILCPQT